MEVKYAFLLPCVVTFIYAVVQNMNYQHATKIKRWAMKEKKISFQAWLYFFLSFISPLTYLVVEAI